MKYSTVSTTIESLTAAVDLIDARHIWIQIMSSGFQSRLLNASLAWLDQQHVRVLGQWGRKTGDDTFETSRDCDRLLNFNRVEIGVDRIAAGVEHSGHDALCGCFPFFVNLREEVAIAQIVAGQADFDSHVTRSDLNLLHNLP